jgi:hypothetical protein
VATTFFVAMFALMHVLRPEVSPLKGDVSRYQEDLYSGLMNAGFLALGLAILGAGVELRKCRRAGAPLLFGAGVASLLVAAFPPALGASAAVYRIHETAGFVMIAAAIGGAAVGTGAFQPERSMRFFGPLALAMSRIAAVTGSLLLLSIAAPRTPLASMLGLLQRTTLTAIALWIIAVSRSSKA